MSPWSVKSLIEEFHLMVDVCASEENRVLLNYISEEQDALTQPWKWDSWMNPDYKYQGVWVNYAIRQVKESKITIVALLRVDTSNRYFQRRVMEITPEGNPWKDPLVQVEIRWIVGRVSYWKNGSPQPKKDRPPFASAVVIWSPRN